MGNGGSSGPKVWYTIISVEDVKSSWTVGMRHNINCVMKPCGLQTGTYLTSFRHLCREGGEEFDFIGHLPNAPPRLTADLLQLRVMAPSA